ncbi:hypothetical protein ON003_01615 [Janibacter hoylei]|uniref:hypothetical protein n=1 Tax=Janibacter hoylei TaxID=364298 RepID=UPI0022384DB1|nr:hypothetical protein [Janibacter hoylei]MCW4600450.1 hypothetical protein [Janibacter hoylei]
MSDASISNQFSDYYGVVLNHQHGGPLRWSATHQTWLRRTDARLADVDFAWAGEPVDGDEVDEDELAVALELAQTFRDQHHFCDRCWGAPSPVTHFITTDVAGDPTVYCVQRPSHDVVGGDCCTDR